MVTLTLIGLILSFLGAFGLVLDSLINFGKPKSTTSVIYKGDNIKEIIRHNWHKGGLKPVKITKEEIKLISALSLISLGFFLQILDFFI